MSLFRIQHGPTPLYTWNLEDATVSAHETVVLREGIMVIEENHRVGFSFSDHDPDLEYRLSIGDIPVADLMSFDGDPGGAVFGNMLLWQDDHYFDSGRGRTTVRLDSRPREDDSANWSLVFHGDLYVHPTKLGDARYEIMSEEMRTLSQELLHDLYGKSKRSYEIRLSEVEVVVRSSEQELGSIESVLLSLEKILTEIAKRPISRVERKRVRRMYYGAQRLDRQALNLLQRQGRDPRSSSLPLSVSSPILAESYDLPEHRFLRAFLELLVRRARYCKEIAASHIGSIESERVYRDINFGGRPSLFETQDLPRIRRLEKALVRADRVALKAQMMIQLPFVEAAKSEFSEARQGLFQRSREYSDLFATMRKYLIGNAVWYRGDDESAVAKLTWRLFEQWCYLRIVDAFRLSGVDLKEWGQALRESLVSRYTVDFDRGLMFEGSIGRGLRLRFRYEPWIMGRESAIATGETLCRGPSGDVAWSPDIVIECLRLDEGRWTPVYAVVIDAKYSPKITRQHWNGVDKYMQIRSTDSGRQLVKQLWLISPGEEPQLSSKDPSVSFSSTYGPSCPPDESVQFHLQVVPSTIVADRDGESPVDILESFASGLIAYLVRSFSREGRN